MKGNPMLIRSMLAASLLLSSAYAHADDATKPAAAAKPAKKEAAKPKQDMWCFNDAEGKEVWADGDTITDEKTCKDHEGKWVPKKK